MRIRDHLRWQDSTDLDAFITRLNDTEARVRTNIQQYVVGPGVFERLDLLLKGVGERLDDNRDVGRYIHGAFGCGKSNLMAVLGKMLESEEEVYDLGHPRLRELRTRHPWLDRHKTLVVKINMMDQVSLVRALYEGYARALPPGTAPPSFTDEERVFGLIDKDAQRFGGMAELLEQAAAAQAFDDIPEMPRGMPGALFVEYYERLRRGDTDKRLSLASALLNWRNHGESPVRADDLWIDARPGLDRIARHARDNGYTAITWMVDELVIWIRGKTRAEYITQLTNLSAMVDHDAARVVPFFVAVAVQMDVARTCPQDLSEKDFQEQFGFIRDRFQPQLNLEDQDLYEVAAERVLARSDDLEPKELQAFEAAIDRAFDKNKDAIRALSGGLSPELVRRLYPFNPALLRILVDVTQALSRNRTSIAALYRLLARYADLEVGQFVPVGALWDFVFESENVAYVRQNTASVLCQRMADTHETWQRMEGKLDAVARECGAEPNELRQLVRTALLCQLSDRPYFPDGRSLGERVTASTLLHLNQTDVASITERTGISKVARLFRRLNGVAPHVQVTGAAADPVIHVKIEQLDIDRVLVAARAEVGSAQRFAYMRKLLMDQLGLNLGTRNEGPVDLLWRGTKRRGRVRLDNVRTLPYSASDNAFDPGSDQFLVLVDYPYDEGGKTREDDLENARRARSQGGPKWTLAWLPDHLSPSEMESLTNAAAIEQIRKEPRRFFENHSPREADAAARALEAYQATRRADLEEAVRRLYFADGIVHGMNSRLETIDSASLDRTRAVEVLGRLALDNRYPNHPSFTRRVGVAELAQVADWVVRAAKTGQTVDLKASDMALVESVVLPLEVAHKGPSGITRRADGQFLAPILSWVGARIRINAAELRKLLMAEPAEASTDEARKLAFGLSKEVANFFLYYLMQVEGFEARVGDHSATVHGLGDVAEQFTLVKEEVVDAVQWERALKVADRLLGVAGRADLPNPPEQAKLCREVAAAARPLADSLRGFDAGLRAICVWAGVAPAQSARATTSGDLLAFLESVLADAGNASRARQLAALHDKGSLDVFRTLRTKLTAEAGALPRIEAQKIAFQQIDKRGSDEDRTAVVTRLRNLLKDPITTSTLAGKVESWATETEGFFTVLLASDDERGREEAERQRREEAERQAELARKAQEEAERQAEAARKAQEEAERQRREAEAALAEARRRAQEEAERRAEVARRAQEEAERQRLEAERARVEAERAAREREEAMKARTETLKAVDRARAPAEVQAGLERLLEASTADRFTIRIIVEPAE
jgi:hypothetical protein